MEVLRQFESLLYTLTLWLLFIPRMFVGLVLKPWKIVDFVDTELGRDPAERFRGAVNPLLFFVIVIAIPSAFALSIAANSHVAQATAAAPDLLAIAGRVSLQYKIEMLSVFLLCYPLGYAFVTNRRLGVEITLEGMRRSYYVQCLCCVSFALALSALGLTVLLVPGEADLLDRPDIDGVQIVFTAILSWFIVSEVIVLRRMANVGIGRALALTFYGYALGTAMALFAEIPLVFALMSGFGSGG